MLKKIKRSEIVNMAKRLGINPNDYVSQLFREYPEIEIENDLSHKDSKI